MPELNLKDRIISSRKRAFVVGIVNATPDSFYEKSRGGVERAFQLIDEGADILDIGGESTRPGFEEISAKDEIERVISVVRAIRKESDIPISIDTRKKSVFEACFYEGADILNDISSFEFDSEMMTFVAETNVPVILTHVFHCDENSRKTDPDIIKTVSNYFYEKVRLARDAGIDENRIIIDPGIGFGKTFEENMTLIDKCGTLCQGEYKIMMALSRKRCIGQMIGDMNADRLQGTVQANLRSVKSGATFIRVHDVLEAFRSLK